MIAKLSAFLLGLLFALGLGLSGMTLPAKVIGFLDVAGDWDPSLAGVMAAGLAVLLLTRRLRPAAPLLAPSYARLPTDRVTRKLVIGSALFGLGWGLSGFCPGPAVVSLGAAGPEALIFLPAMLLGMKLGTRLGAPRLARGLVSQEALTPPSELHPGLDPSEGPA